MKNKKFKLGILFSGGKDSCYAAYLAKQKRCEIACLITIQSDNKESYMFHTPSINSVKKQANTMSVPLVFIKSRGEKEKELLDLEKAIKTVIRKFGIKGVVSGAVESVYQASRVQKICNKLGIECFNPLWQKNQMELLNDLIKDKFEAIITGVFAYPLNEKWLGRKINLRFIEEMKRLNEKYGINPAGEGGEYESFVLNCPLFKSRLKATGFKDFGNGNSWRREIKVG